jgi:dTDP-4-dehydrorhamnose reductase
MMAIRLRRWRLLTSASLSTAAYTDVDRAETAEGMAFAVNAQGPAQLATGPINAYGRTKLAGE